MENILLVVINGEYTYRHVQIKDDNENYNHSSVLFKNFRVIKLKDIFRNQVPLLVFDCLQGTSIIKNINKF